jgi:cytoplasmic iron level regulating protein YaaA (DUF328/UPF0246 family)
MLIILSPAKTMQETGTEIFERSTVPEYMEKTARLASELRKFTADQLASVLKVSPKLARLNYGRLQQWDVPKHQKTVTPALLSYQGEVFRGLDAASLKADDFRFAQEHLRILSGFYGVLRPLDRVLPYRLEIGGGFSPEGFDNLYAFWKETITKAIDRSLSEQGDRVLVNLASNEYFKSIDRKKLNVQVITPVFKESRDDGFKMVTVYAKKARGLMARFIIQNRLTKPEQLKLFDAAGYFFNEPLSDGNKLVFTR